MANADDYCFVDLRGAYCIVKRIRNSAVHLYTVLVGGKVYCEVMNKDNEENKNYKALETMGILALAFLVFNLVWGKQIFLYCAVGCLFIGIFIKALAILFSNGWLAFAGVLGSINSKVILSLLFFLCLLPLALLYRSIKGDFLLIKFDGESRSLWNKRDHKYEPEDLKNLW